MSQQALPTQDSFTIDDIPCLQDETASHPFEFATSADIAKVCKRLDKIEESITKMDAMIGMISNLDKKLDALLGNSSFVASEGNQRMASSLSGKVMLFVRLNQPILTIC